MHCDAAARWGACGTVGTCSPPWRPPRLLPHTLLQLTRPLVSLSATPLCLDCTLKSARVSHRVSRKAGSASTFQLRALTQAQPSDSVSQVSQDRTADVKGATLVNSAKRLSRSFLPFLLPTGAKARAAAARASTPRGGQLWRARACALEPCGPCALELCDPARPGRKWAAAWV